MIVDFVLTFDGDGDSESEWKEAGEVAATAPYFRRCKELGQSRMLILGGLSSKARDITAPRDRVLNRMRSYSGGKFDKQSVVCLFGCSNGAAVALAVAASLRNDVTVNYVCLADLPLFMGGRSPPIPGVDARLSDLKLAMGTQSDVGSRAVRAVQECPEVMLNPDISANVKENFFQNSGNKVRRGTLRWNKWFWCSEMHGEEVHGAITNSGWNARSQQEVAGLSAPNPRFFLNGQDDIWHQVLDDHVKENIWPRRWPVEVAKF